jgi:uncharacterized membrane protein
MEIEATLSGFLHHPGEAFPAVLTVVLLATAGVMLMHLVLALLGGRSSRPHRSLRIWEKLIYLGVLVSVTGLAVTSFFTVLQYGVMKGWWLFAHMFGAGALTGLLPLLAIIWAGSSRFGRGRAGEEEETYAEKFFWLPKLMFWLFLASSLVVILTMLFSMLPLFGTDGLHALLDLHRYAGLMAVVVLAFHFYCLVLQRVKVR